MRPTVALPGRRVPQGKHRRDEEKADEGSGRAEAAKAEPVDEEAREGRADDVAHAEGFILG